MEKIVYFLGKQKSSSQDYGFYYCVVKTVGVTGFLTVCGCLDIGSKHIFIFSLYQVELIWAILLVQIQSKLPLTSQRIFCFNRAFVYTNQTLKELILSLLSQISR